MPSGNAPQVKGIDATVEWYENAAIPAFAVAYLKDIFLKFDGNDIDQGADLLRAWMTKVKEFDSAAVYQLRLYEDLKGKSIRNNTPYDMAFKFVLNERDTSNLPVRSDSAISNTDLISILKENAQLKAENAVLSLKVDQYEDEEEEADKLGTVEKKPMGEQVLEQFIPALGAIGERIVDLLMPPATVAKVSGIVIDTGNIDEEKVIEQSIRRLRNKIPDKPGIGGLLMKLADMAERSPSEFNFYMGALMNRRF